MPTTKADLLARIHQAWTALLAEIDTFDTAAMLVPDAGGWTLKDNLAHLSEWERFVIRSQFEGQPPAQALNLDKATLAAMDETSLNAMFLKRNQARPLPEVLDDLHQTHARLLAALDQAPEAALQTETWSLGPKPEPLMVWVVYNTYEHYAEHRRTISRYAK